MDVFNLQHQKLETVPVKGYGVRVIEAEFPPSGMAYSTLVKEGVWLIVCPLVVTEFDESTGVPSNAVKSGTADCYSA
jgi:hypothetical protein